MPVELYHGSSEIIEYPQMRKTKYMLLKRRISDDEINFSMDNFVRIFRNGSLFL